MRTASYNVENFFARAKVLETASWAEGRPVLAAHAELNTLLAQPTHSSADKARNRQVGPPMPQFSMT